jgi:CHAT domain-containing protein
MQVGLANVRHFQARYGEAERLYAQVERNARTRRDLALEAQVHWGRALSEGRQGQLGISAEEFSEAAALFHRIGEPANEAFMIGQRGDVLFQFGEDNSAFEAKLRALTLQRHDPDPTRRVSTLMAFGQQLRDAGFAHVSLAVYREARAIASRSARPADRAEADVRLARANVAIGARADAAASLEAMRVDTAAVSDSILRARLRMEVWQSEAQLLADSAPRAAIAEYDSVADYFRRRGILFSMPEPLVSAARLRMQRGDQSAAEANLDEAVRAIERQAAYAHDRNVDRTMRAARQATFGALVQLELARGDTAAAFGMAERARANPDVERSRLPENVVYLAYSLLPDRCVLWVATNRSLRAIAVSMDTASLLSHARGFRRAAASPADSARAASESRMLFDLLIAPARREIDRSKEVVVVADGPLSEVPFALLRAADGSRLFERAPLSYMNAVRPPRAATNEMRRVTLVGNPDFDARIFDALPQLPSAEAEVRRLRSMHGDARLISGRLATKRAIVDALSQSELFHFAGHAQLAPSAPELSRLVLARAEGGLLENELTAAEIAALRLERLQLVILSACGTSQANSTRDPSGNGLADAFMTAGVRAVIASAWQADDAATSALMEALHRRLSQGEAPAAALRDAQLELLRRNGSLGTEATWGGFRVFRS